MTLNGGLIALLAFVAGAVFLGLATFNIAVSDIPLVAAGLFCCAIGFVLR
jgi:hypothetical protein